MSHPTHTATRTRGWGRWAFTAAGLATALLAACPIGPASAQQDLRSPDARDAAIASQTRNYQDLRSPDARDAGLASEARDYQDLRSPDARDAGRVPSTPSPAPSPTDDGTNWGDIGIVAGGVLLLVGLGVLAMLSRRRLTARKARTAAASG
jgi:hypothetical protein